MYFKNSIFKEELKINMKLHWLLRDFLKNGTIRYNFEEYFDDILLFYIMANSETCKKIPFMLN